MSKELAAIELMKAVLMQSPAPDGRSKEQVFEIYWDCLNKIDGRPKEAAPRPVSVTLRSQSRNGRRAGRLTKNTAASPGRREDASRELLTRPTTAR
jgi:hypothetical protein